MSKTPAAALLLCLLTAVVYRPSLDNGFFFDDREYLLENQLVRRGLTGEGVVTALRGAYAANWHPVTWLSHMTDVELFGLDAARFHQVNLVLHALNTVLVLLVWRGATGRLGAATLVAGLFAVHPLHVESVAWISERKDLLCALFWLLAMGAHVHHARRPGAGRSLAVVLCAALALLSKPMAVTLPLALLLLDFWPLGRLRRRPLPVLAEKLPLLALSLLGGLMTLRAQASGGAVRTLAEYSLPERLANAVVAYGLYLRKALLPFDLAVFYPYVRRSPSDAAVLLAAALLAALSWGAWRLRRRAPAATMGWLWYAVTLLPVIGVVQVGDQALADRYTYLPLLGVFSAVAAAPGPARAGPRRSARPGLAAAAGAVVLLLAVGARRQVQLWDDPETLLRHAMRVVPGNWKAQIGLALALEEKGRAGEAEAHYRGALVRHPGSTEALYNLGALLESTGRPAEAVGFYREALRLEPRDRLTRETLAAVLERLGRAGEAAGVRAGATAAERATTSRPTR